MAGHSALAQSLPPYEIIPLIQDFNNGVSSYAIRVDRVKNRLSRCVVHYKFLTDVSINGYCEDFQAKKLDTKESLFAAAFSSTPHGHSINGGNPLWVVNIKTGAVSLCGPLTFSTRTPGVNGGCFDVPDK